MSCTNCTTPGVAFTPPTLVRLDLGCGTKKKAGMVGVDRVAFPGVDVVLNIGTDRWPWNDASVDEAHSSHMIEHLWPWERIHFANELYRVLKPGAKATISAPDFRSARAIGDLTHVWPPLAASWPFHLSKKWRDDAAPHGNEPCPYPTAPGGLLPAYTCDFEHTAGYAMATDPEVAGRNPEWQRFAARFYCEAAGDFIFTLIKPGVK